MPKRRKNGENASMNKNDRKRILRVSETLPRGVRSVGSGGPLGTTPQSSGPRLTNTRVAIALREKAAIAAGKAKERPMRQGQRRK
jgi:hypothetical protein